MQMLRVMTSQITVTQILCYKYFPANLFHALSTSLELVLVMLIEHLDKLLIGMLYWEKLTGVG